MNQGRIWCVVNPTVGLPLFLGGVATISLIVHASVLSSTTWMANYWNGSAKARTALNDTAAPVALAAPGFAITVTPAVAGDGSGAPTFVVTVTPSATAPATAAAGDDAARARAPDTLALAVPDAR